MILVLDKAVLVWFDQSNYTGAIYVKMDGSDLEEKSSFNKLRLTLSSKLDWGFYIIFTALKITSGKWSLTFVKVFATAKKPCRLITMTTTK